MLRVDVSRFLPWVINLSRNNYFCCGLKKVSVDKSRAWIYFEQQNLVLLLVFHQTVGLFWIQTNYGNRKQGIH